MDLRPRDTYLDKLKKLKDEPFIKVISGVRRCGKSSILDLFELHLLDTGVDRSNIIRFNFDSRDMRKSIHTADELYDLIEKNLGDGRNYVLLDEIQNVDDWEGALISMYTDLDADLYVTGSNAVFMSPDLGTKLVGRYIEIEVLPLSFREWLDFEHIEKHDDPASFEDYLRYGGFPAIALMNSTDLKMTALDGIYRTILDLDVGSKNNVRDPALLRILAEFLIDNIGNVISPKKIADYLTSAGRKTTHNTVDNYLLMMERAFLIYRAKRYDIKGKVLLQRLEKFYVVDLGLRGLMLSSWNSDYGSILENVVYLELRRRGYSISIGKLGETEVDFVATRLDERIYVQVTASMADENVRERELRPLMQIRDGYPKIVMSMDRNIIKDYSGIRNVNIQDWLLEGQE